MGYDQPDESDDANRGDGNRSCQCSDRKNNQAKTCDRQSDYRRLQVAACENIQVSCRDQASDGYCRQEPE